ncbi:MAG: hypothetical protein AAGG50_08030 [Bacteroidota bacterium]
MDPSLFDELYEAYRRTGDTGSLHTLASLIIGFEINEATLCTKEEEVVHLINFMLGDYLSTGDYQATWNAEMLIESVHFCGFEKLIDIMDALVACNERAGDTYGVHDPTLKAMYALYHANPAYLNVFRERLYPIASDSIRWHLDQIFDDASNAQAESS